MNIRTLRSNEYDDWLRLREELWDDFSRTEISPAQAETLANGQRHCVFVAADAANTFVGIVEVSIRDWAEGCATRPVGYIEAWYVKPDQRCNGIGRQLIEAAEDWAKARGCSEMGSDADLSNHISQQSHIALGFQEVQRVVLFSKRLVS